MPESFEPSEPHIKCLALIRGKTSALVKTAISDLDRFAHLVITGAPRECAPDFADSILVRVMHKPLKKCCRAAAIVALEDEPVDAIYRIRTIHPPAHVVIISPGRYDMYKNLLDDMYMMPELGIARKKKTGEGQ